MVKFIYILSAVFISVSSFAASPESCTAAPDTIARATELRTSELPFNVVEEEIEAVLVNDQCIRATSTDESIYTLIQNLLSFENIEVPTEKIVADTLSK